MGKLEREMTANGKQLSGGGKKKLLPIDFFLDRRVDEHFE